jgi:hypothetical protein
MAVQTRDPDSVSDDALRSALMKELGATMQRHDKQWHHWRNWPGTWAIAAGLVPTVRSLMLNGRNVNDDDLCSALGKAIEDTMRSHDALHQHWRAWPGTKAFADELAPSVRALISPQPQAQGGADVPAHIGSASLVDRLKPQHAELARTPSLARAFAHLERLLADGKGRIFAGACYEEVAGAPPALDLQIAINALRASGAMELVATYPTASGALTAGEPKSAHLIALCARGLIAVEASKAIKMDYVLRAANAAPTLAPATSSRQVHNGDEFSAADLERLLKNLMDYRLDPGMNAIEFDGHGSYRFHGNFTRLSAVFNVRTNDPFTIMVLMAAVNANRARPDYIADLQLREGAAHDYHAMLQAAGKEKALQDARAEWAATRPHVAGQVSGQQAHVGAADDATACIVEHPSSPPPSPRRMRNRG